MQIYLAYQCHMRFIMYANTTRQISGVTENSTQTEPVAGAPKVLAGGQGGLLDLELHPDYDKNGWIYLSYVAPKQKGESGRGGNTALMRARLKDNQLIDQQLLFKAQPNYSSKRHLRRAHSV